MLRSREGTHQGCPLGPLGFALGVQPVIAGLRGIPGLVWQSWYLDDGILLGDCASMKLALESIRVGMGQ